MLRKSERREGGGEKEVRSKVWREKGVRGEKGRGVKKCDERGENGVREERGEGRKGEGRK